MEALIWAADDRCFRLDMCALRHLMVVDCSLAALSHLRAGRLVAAFAAAVPGIVEITRRFDFADGAPPIVAGGRSGGSLRPYLRDGRHAFTAGHAAVSLAD